jgi:hypothetical protein
MGPAGRPFSVRQFALDNGNVHSVLQLRCDTMLLSPRDSVKRPFASQQTMGVFA